MLGQLLNKLPHARHSARLTHLQSEEKIALQAKALEAAANGVVLTDTGGIIQWINPAFTLLTGYSFDEAVGQSMRILNSDQHDKTFYQNIWETILAGKVWRGESVDRHKNGSLYVEEQTITPVKNEAGEIIAFIGIQQSITERKRLEKVAIDRNTDLAVLNKSEEESKKALLNVMEDLETTKQSLELEKAKDEAMLASIGEGLIAVDNDRKVIIINKSAEEMLGFKNEDLIGQEITRFPLEDEAGHVLALDKRPTYLAIVTGKTSVLNSYYFVRPDKTRFPIAIIATPIKLDGKILGAIDIFRDITHEREIDKAKTEFVSLASHQLRTPLTAINWYTEMLKDGDLGSISAEQQKYLQEIYVGNRRMTELVDSLLDVSRLELGTFTAEPQPLNAAEALRSVCNEQKKQIEAKQLHFTLSTADNMGLLNFDPKLLKIIFQNLLTNAVKYTPKNKDVQVELSLKPRGQNYYGAHLNESALCLKVADSGYGIPKGQQGSIFTKLFRADNVKALDTQGTGLGLYIVKSIIDHSRGKIWFSSVENQGTTFYAMLPAGTQAKSNMQVLNI